MKPFPRTLALVLVGISLTLLIALLVHPPALDKKPAKSPVTIPLFTTPLGVVREPLPYRIVSFHRGRADKNLIQLAAQLGFNGVQFQIEGSNEDGIADFAARDKKEHLIDFCHSLNMKVTVWVHELADIPPPWLPEYLGDPTPDNPRLWPVIEKRYDWILKDALPTIDGLVLTVVETQVRATAAPVMRRVVDIVSGKCAQYHKSFIARTFVWHPEELASVMQAVGEFPKDMLIMSKIVPQDWQMRGDFAAEIGAVNGRPQIVEFDIAGEYFLKDAVANCMPDLLKRQFDFALSKNAQGICVRVDRDDYNILFQPQEVNLFALGLLAAGNTNDTTDIWNRWATYRYGQKAAPAVVRALKPTADVVAELLSIGPFTHGDTRAFPPLPDEEILTQNWQNWRWNPTYLPAREKADVGDSQFIAALITQKQAAAKLAAQSLADLDLAKPDLPPIEFDILKTRLLSNQFHLAMRTPMILAALHLRAMEAATTPADHTAAADAFAKDIAAVRAAAANLDTFPKPRFADYLGRTWRLDTPLNVNRNQLYKWAYDAQAAGTYY